MANFVPVSLADLADAGVRLRPTDAVTIVRALILQVANGILPGVPSAHVIRLAPSGGITVEGPVVASGRPVPRAAQLLASLLRGSGRPTAEPTPLRRVIARAIQEPSEFTTLPELAEALGPFAAQDPSAAIKELTTRWTEAARAMGLHAAGPTDDRTESDSDEDEDDVGSTGSLSVSDVRRARRDTGLSLEEVSKRSRIPVSMLRQLEWGYLRNWPHGLYGRTQLVRYARAAGLDRQLVLEAMLPLVRRIPEVTTPADPAPAPQPPPVATIPAVEPPAIIVIDPAAAHEDLVDEDRPVAQVSAPPPAMASPQVLPEPEESNLAERIFAGRWDDPAPAFESSSWPSITAAELPRFRRRDRRAPPLVDGGGCRRANAGNGSRGMGRAVAVDDRRPGLRENRSAAAGKRATRRPCDACCGPGGERTAQILNPRTPVGPAWRSAGVYERSRSGNRRAAASGRRDRG